MRTYRRRQEQISKDYICMYDCGKAYGSYAALYTHIKHKHPEGKLHEIKSSATLNKPKTGRKGRPIKKEETKKQMAGSWDCQLCQQEPCLCDSVMNEGAGLNCAMQFLQNTPFMDLVIAVGMLSLSDAQSWMRSSQDSPNTLTADGVQMMYLQFLKQYEVDSTDTLSKPVVEMLAYGTRYWSSSMQRQLMEAMFVVLIFGDTEEHRVDQFLSKNYLNFKNILKCREGKQKEWQQWKESVRKLKEAE